MNSLSLCILHFVWIRKIVHHNISSLHRSTETPITGPISQICFHKEVSSSTCKTRYSSSQKVAESCFTICIVVFRSSVKRVLLNKRMLHYNAPKIQCRHADVSRMDAVSWWPCQCWAHGWTWWSQTPFPTSVILWFYNSPSWSVQMDHPKVSCTNLLSQKCWATLTCSGYVL